MNTVYFLFASLFFFFFFSPAPVYSQSLHASRNPTPIGSNVTLYTQDSVTAGAWMFNNSLIAMIYPGNVIMFDEWENRVILNFTENYTSLTITSLRLIDSGEYTLQKDGGRFSVDLSVQGEVMPTLFHPCSLSLYEVKIFLWNLPWCFLSVGMWRKTMGQCGGHKQQACFILLTHLDNYKSLKPCHKWHSNSTSVSSLVTWRESTDRNGLRVKSPFQQVEQLFQSDRSRRRVSLFQCCCTIKTCVFIWTEPISNVTLTAQATDLVEFNDSAVFTCSVSSGTSLSYVWLNGSSAISGGDRVQLSNGGANLTLMVTRYDQGPFSCNVSNGISQEVSASVYLKISCEF